VHEYGLGSDIAWKFASFPSPHFVRAREPVARINRDKSQQKSAVPLQIICQLRCILGVPADP